jgi:type III pantothenate kinase
MEIMNLVIDSGNTRFKAATFNGDSLKEKYSFLDKEELKDFLRHHTFDHSIASSVSVDGNEILSWINSSRKFLLTHLLPLPIQIKYKTPKTLGVDRIAAACGAIDIFANRDALVIDAGTCITYDYVDRMKNYEGGAISPGIEMRFEALHTFTERLPLVAKNGDSPLTGNSTETSIRSGVLNGIVAEMEGIINEYKHLYPELGVVLCGGDSFFFENKVKPTIFAAPDLVLSGLNRILRHNAAF